MKEKQRGVILGKKTGQANGRKTWACKSSRWWSGAVAKRNPNAIRAPLVHRRKGGNSRNARGESR